VSTVKYETKEIIALITNFKEQNPNSSIFSKKKKLKKSWK